MFERSRVAMLGAVLALVAACSRATPEQLYADAQSALAAGETRTAEIHLRNLLKDDPNHRAGRILLGELSLASGDLAAAEHNLRQASELGASQDEVFRPLAQVLVGQGKFAEALSFAEAFAPADDAGRVVRLSVIGAAQRGLGDGAAAVAAYESAVALQPKSAEIRTALASAYLTEGRTADARRLATEVNTEQPEFVPAMLLLGGVEMAATRYAAAEELFQRAVTLEQSRNRGQLYASAISQVIEAQLSQRKMTEATANADALLALQPTAPAARYLKARIETEQGNLTAAEARLEALIADAPSYTPAYLLLGIINNNQEQFGQAEMYLRRAATDSPQDSRAQLLLAEVLIRRNNVGAARDVLDRATSANDAVFLALAGSSSLQAGQAELAAEYFARSEANKPADLRGLAELANVYVAAGELDRAIRVLESSKFAEAESARAQGYLLTLVHLRRGDTAAAESAARSIDDGSLESANLRAGVAMAAGNLVSATEILTAVVARDAGNVPALSNLARIAIAQNDKPRAAQYLRTIVEQRPGEVSALLGLTQLAVERRDFAEAEGWVARLPEPSVRDTYAGDLHAAQGRYADASADYERAFKARPSAELVLKMYATGTRAGRPDARNVLLSWVEQHPKDATVNFALGSIALDGGDLEGAAARYETVIATAPRHPAALNNLAWIYSERGDARALDLAQRAHDAAPNDASIADTLGWLHVQRGAAATGLPLLERASGASSQPDIRYHWAVALADTGARAKAVEVLTELLGSGAQFRDRAAAEQRLATLRAAGN